MRKLLLFIGLSLSVPALAATPTGQPGVLSEGNIMAGAGFGGFTSTLGAETGVGPTWEVRGGVVLAHFFGLEADYQGLSSSVDSGVLAPSNTHFMSHQITGNFLPGIPLMLGGHQLRPYGLIGVGYARVGANNTTFGLIDSEGVNAVSVPLGAGLRYNVTREFVIDARYNYNFLNTAGGDTWNVGLNLGATFGS